MNRSLAAQIGVICGSGLLLVLAFPVSERLAAAIPAWPWELGAWIALVPIFLMVREQPLKRAFLSGYCFGCLFFFGSLSWIVVTMIDYGNMSPLLSYSVLLLLVLYLAAFIGLFFMLSKWLSDRLGLPFAAIAPPLWVVLEYHRSWLLSGFPWNSLGYSQYRLLPVIQIADLASVYGVSFMIVLVNACLADLVSPTHRPKTKTVVAGITAVTLLACLGYGHAGLSRHSDGHPAKVCLVQGNFSQDEKWEEGNRNLTLETYLNLTRSAGVAKPDLVVWPEAAMPFRLRYSALAYQAIAEVSQQLSIDLLVGSPDSIKAGRRNRYFNSVFQIDRLGRLVGRYDKIHLVPFGEYVPLQKLLFFVDKMTEGAVGNFSAGSRFSVFHTAAGPVSVYICYETIFPDLLRRFTLQGACFLASITNDAWFGRSAAGYQHFSMTVFRAIENRLAVVRAANTGISGFVDRQGRIGATTKLFERTTVCDTIMVKDPAELTLYTRYGDLFVCLCALFLGGIGIILIRLSAKG